MSTGSAPPRSLTRRSFAKGLIACSCFAAQEERRPPLYLISACSNKIGTDTFPSILYRFSEERGDLLVLRTLVPADAGTRGILYSTDLRLWAATYPSLRAKRIVVVRFDKRDEDQTLEFDYEEKLLPIEAALFVRGGEAQVAIYLCTVDIKEQYLKEFSLTSGAVKDGDWGDYRYLRAPGGVGGIQPLPDNSVELFPYADGQLVFRKGGRSIESGLTLPPRFRYAEDDYAWAHVYLPELVVLSSELTSSETDGPIGRRLFRIGVLADRRWQWHEWTVPGDMSWARNWGKWVGVIVCAERLKVKRTRPSEGFAERRKKMTATGLPFDWYWDREYLPGTLLLYNVDTRKQYTLETGQGDSEILLVERDLIYYRVYDRLFRGKIGESSIIEVELLAKRPEIADIHWAFRSSD